MMILDLFRRQAAGLVPKTFNLQSAIFNLQSSQSKNLYQSFALKSQNTEVLDNESKLPNFTSLIRLLSLTELYWAIAYTTSSK
ncbi:MAG: hypothetical protein HC773_24190 [Scytonema sp. CRU_2_7]|nr:hypothetical protein [Scytonema sp. CRU_2_7]